MADVVRMFVVIVVDIVAGSNSRIVVVDLGPSRILGDGVFIGEMLPKFRQTKCHFKESTSKGSNQVLVNMTNL